MSLLLLDKLLLHWSALRLRFLSYRGTCQLGSFGLLLHGQDVVNLQKFSPLLEGFPLLLSDLFEEFLGVGPDLAERAALHVGVDLLPVRAISLDEDLKEVALGGAPSSDLAWTALGCFRH